MRPAERRARAAIAAAARRLAMACRDPRVSPNAIAKAERHVSDAFARFGGLMLVAAARARRAT